MKPKLKPDLDLESIQADLITSVCEAYKPGVSLRAVAKSTGLSPMKVRKILITGNAYSTDLSTEIGELWKDGKKPGEIAEILNMTVANVNSYLPYERIIYGMDERSVEADRQQRYRDRKKGNLPPVEEKTARPKVERVRNKTMIIVIGKKLKKLLPTEVLDETSDPLAREKSYTWGSNIGGDFTLHEPPDPDKSIWCAEMTTAGRGAKKKSGVVLMSANCGFAVITSLPPAPMISVLSEEELRNMDWAQRRAIEQENTEKLREYRAEIERTWIGAIRDGMLAFCLPKDKVLDYTDTVARVELVKGRISTPAVRLEELIERELKWSAGADPVTAFNVRGNWTNRKFGNGDYRRVDEAVMNMLEMSSEERRAWLDEFLRPLRESMAGE